LACSREAEAPRPPGVRAGVVPDSVAPADPREPQREQVAGLAQGRAIASRLFLRGAAA